MGPSATDWIALVEAGLLNAVPIALRRRQNSLLAMSRQRLRTVVVRVFERGAEKVEHVRLRRMSGAGSSNPNRIAAKPIRMKSV